MCFRVYFGVVCVRADSEPTESLSVTRPFVRVAVLLLFFFQSIFNMQKLFARARALVETSNELAEKEEEEKFREWICFLPELWNSQIAKRNSFFFRCAHLIGSQLSLLVFTCDSTMPTRRWSEKRRTEKKKQKTIAECILNLTLKARILCIGCHCVFASQFKCRHRRRGERNGPTDHSQTKPNKKTENR